MSPDRNYQAFYGLKCTWADWPTVHIWSISKNIFFHVNNFLSIHEQKSFSRIEPHYLISCSIGLPHWFDHYNRSTFLFGLGRTYCSGVWAGFKNYDRTREKTSNCYNPCWKKERKCWRSRHSHWYVGSIVLRTKL